MSERLTAEQLAAIHERLKMEYRQCDMPIWVAMDDVPALLAEVEQLQIEITTIRDENYTLRKDIKTARHEAEVRLGAMNEANERRMAMSDERDAALARLAAIKPLARAIVRYCRAKTPGDSDLWLDVEHAVDDLPADLRAELEGNDAE